MNYSVSISGKLYSELRDHLYPGDGKEAVAVALCGRHQYNGAMKLTFHKLISIPYNQCQIRRSDFIQWSTNILSPHLMQASKKGWAIVKIHSHPTGYPDFSQTDDKSDIDLFNSVYGWMDNDEPHASLVMLPEGEIFGRIITPALKFIPIDKISLAGDDLKFWFRTAEKATAEFSKRTAQAFGNGTTSLLRKLKIGVVGCSGTGSPVIEQLVRLGIGKIVLVDPDKVEEKNLNRILNTTKDDARKKQYKTEVLKAAIDKIGLATEVTTFNKNVYDDLEVINSLASCDAIFGCVDSVDGRHLLNQIATFYVVPYIDIGVKIIADGKGGISQICGAIHFLSPGGSSLQSRDVYTSEDLRASGLFRTNIKEYHVQKKSGYIVNVNVDSPAVISINMYAASMAVNEFLARIHPYRYNLNMDFAIIRFSISDAYSQRERDGMPDAYLAKYVGRGNMIPLLNMPELG
jgi:hypothetical protein